MTLNDAPNDGGRLYAGESTAERTARRRQQFLDAALEVFGTTGYRAATVRQLCRQAGLTDRYFYESFGNTEDLLVAAYEREFAHLQAQVMTALQDAVSDPDPMAGVRTALRCLYDMADDPRVARMCWVEVMGISARIDAMYIGTLERFAELILAFARMRFPHMDVPEPEMRLLGIAIVGAVSQSIAHGVLSGRSVERSIRVAAISRLLEGLILTLRFGNTLPYL